MQRATWTDERLDDLADEMRSGFQRVDRGFERIDLRFESVDRDIRDLRAELRSEVAVLRGEFGGLRGELGGLREIVVRVGTGLIVALVGVIGAILAAAL